MLPFSCMTRTSPEMTLFQQENRALSAATVFVSQRLSLLTRSIPITSLMGENTASHIDQLQKNGGREENSGKWRLTGWVED